MRGSITIFATMLLMLVSQFLFTVLEAGRNLTLTNIACMNSEAVAESVFAQYCRPLWDEYHLLAYDAGSDAMGNVDIENVKSYMKKLTTDNFKISDSGAFAGGTIVNGTSMLRLSMDELESMKYVLMTDDGGDVYRPGYFPLVGHTALRFRLAGGHRARRHQRHQRAGDSGDGDRRGQPFGRHQHDPQAPAGRTENHPHRCRRQLGRLPWRTRRLQPAQ